jgi:c-di-GMP-binding flagellar brake protein YcgR
MQRRSEPRFSVWESVVLSVMGKQQTYWPATVVDISQSGYRLLTGVNLKIGTEVLITLNSVVIFGTVRHCEPHDADSFTAGVQISQVTSEEDQLSCEPVAVEALDA